MKFSNILNLFFVVILASTENVINCDLIDLNPEK